MKKNNRLLRVGGILLVLTLITSCFVGGTFAKYITESDGKDNARVAKWGVEVEVQDSIFSDTYVKDNSGVDEAFVGSHTVISTSSEENVVAPGTKGSFGGVKISGTPEVAVHIVTTASVKAEGWDNVDGVDFYCPLTFTITNNSTDVTKTVNGLDYASNSNGGEGGFVSALQGAIQDATTQYVPAGQDLSALVNDVTYSWEWAFEGATGSNGQNQEDDLDTILGNRAAENSAPTIDISIDTSVTQVN